MQTWLKSFYRTAPATLIITSACIILWLVAAFQARSLTNVFSNSELVHAMTVWGPAFEIADHWWTPIRTPNLPRPLQSNPIGRRSWSSPLRTSFNTHLSATSWIR